MALIQKIDDVIGLIDNYEATIGVILPSTQKDVSKTSCTHHTHQTGSIDEDNIYAMCVLKPDGNSGVSGIVKFKQNLTDNITTIDYDVNGLSEGLHGFHIHEFGDLSKGCKSAGGHYNPFKLTHGGPNDKKRHVGDLGNIIADKNGNAKGTINDKLVKLIGMNMVAGRSIVVHKDKDDLGKGGFDDSLTTGHAGARLACGIIVRSKN